MQQKSAAFRNVPADRLELRNCRLAFVHQIPSQIPSDIRQQTRTRRVGLYVSVDRPGLGNWFEKSTFFKGFLQDSQSFCYNSDSDSAVLIFVFQL